MVVNAAFQLIFLLRRIAFHWKVLSIALIAFFFLTSYTNPASPQTLSPVTSSFPLISIYKIHENSVAFLCTSNQSLSFPFLFTKFTTTSPFMFALLEVLHKNFR